MGKNAYRFAALVFIAIGVFLLAYSWPPGRGSLQEDQARIIRIIPHQATRYNVELRTPEGVELSCVENALNGWPPSAINRCPIEKFKPLVGQTVMVLHDGKHIYEVKTKDEIVLSYDVFRGFQLMIVLVALVMVGIAVVVWYGASSSR